MSHRSVPADEFSVRVPASTSNLGPGFDCLGAALELYVEVSVRPADASSGVEIQYDADGVQPEVPLEDDLLYRGVMREMEAAGRSEPDLLLSVHSEIPTGGGLGSSAAAAAAGGVIGTVLTDRGLPRDHLFRTGYRIEGHPDNIAPSVYGGVTLSYVTEEGPAAIRVAPELPAELVLIRSEARVETREARERLPETVSHEDAVFNLTRTGLLVHALENDRPDLLRDAMRDRLHQPYRAPLIDGGADALEAGYDKGALGIWISGAGPTLACLLEAGDRSPAEAAAGRLEENGLETEVQEVSVASSGVQVFEEEPRT